MLGPNMSRVDWRRLTESGRGICGGEHLQRFWHHGEVKFGSDIGCGFLCGNSRCRGIPTTMTIAEKTTCWWHRSNHCPVTFQGEVEET